ncbi:hypothetical protein IWZ01DRAFT_491371 [Phyllosticta capitalensis]
MLSFLSVLSCLLHIFFFKWSWLVLLLGVWNFLLHLSLRLFLFRLYLLQLRQSKSKPSIVTTSNIHGQHMIHTCSS